MPRVMEEVTSFNSCTEVQHEHISDIKRKLEAATYNVRADDVF